MQLFNAINMRGLFAGADAERGKKGKKREKGGGLLATDFERNRLDANDVAHIVQYSTFYQPID